MNTDQSHGPLIELPESGQVRAEGRLVLVRIYRGKLDAVRAAVPAEVCFGVGPMRGWQVSRHEIREIGDGTALLFVFWQATKSPFLFQPGSVCQVLDESVSQEAREAFERYEHMTAAAGCIGDGRQPESEGN